MLFKTLLLIRTLRIIKAARVAAVVPGESAPLRIHLETERVAAALGENFKAFGLGMISPHQLAEKMHRGPVDSGADNTPGGRASVASIQPAIWPPAQTIRHRMRVLKKEVGRIQN